MLQGHVAAKWPLVCEHLNASSNSKVWYHMKLMDTASFQCFTGISNHIHVTKLVSLGWMLTLWINNEFEKAFLNSLLWLVKLMLLTNHVVARWSTRQIKHGGRQKLYVADKIDVMYWQDIGEHTKTAWRITPNTFYSIYACACDYYIW